MNDAKIAYTFGIAFGSLWLIFIFTFCVHRRRNLNFFRKHADLFVEALLHSFSNSTHLTKTEVSPVFFFLFIFFSTPIKYFELRLFERRQKTTTFLV